MKRSTLLRILAGGLLGLVLVAGGALWLLGSDWGRQQLERLIRERMAQRSDLVLGPLEIDFSLWRDFPYLTASVHHVLLTDTAFQRSVDVLRVGRADLRLELRPLLRGQFRAKRLTLQDAEFRQLTDAQGHDWGLRGRGPRQDHPSGPPDFDLDSLLIRNLRVSDRNELHNSGFAARVATGGLVVRVRNGQAQVRGRLQGRLDYLRTSRGNLFEQEPIVAAIRYRYNFRERQGTFLRTSATLNGDTVRINGTHRGAGPGETRGTHLNLAFRGNQPLLEVLRVALPPSLERFLRGAHSSSHAHIHYTIRGVSGPTTRPRMVLRFALRNAQVRWADSLRRIRRWDARGVYDNGPAHNSQSTMLAFEECRLYSSAGQLDARLTVRNFTSPHLNGHVVGRTELQTVASVVVPDLWRARAGQVSLDLRFHGALPDIPDRATRLTQRPDTLLPPLAARGTVRLEHAAFDIPSRQARMRALNVRVRLLDSVWRLENLAGQLNGMQIKANATTTHLLAYVSGQHPTTAVTGRFAVDELQLPELRRLLAAPSRAPRPAARQRPARNADSRSMQVADMMNLLPPGLHLDIDLECGRLVVAADTLRALAASIRHDGRHVQLRNLRARVWGGQLSGLAGWATDTLNPQPVLLELAAHFPILRYRQLLARVTHPPRRATGKKATDPTLREILLSANGRVTATIDQFILPGTNRLRNVELYIDKNGSHFDIPALTFRTGPDGRGRISASATLAGIHLARAQAMVELRYGMLDVQQLLQLLAALNTTPDPTPAQARPAARSAGGTSPFLDGTVTGRVHVVAARVRYGVLQGQDFELRSTLEAGRARVQECSLQAFGGQLQLQGVLQTDSGAHHHPLRAQLRLRNVQLPQLFALAAPLGLDALGPDNVRGQMNAEADVQTDLDHTFLPRLNRTRAFARTNLQHLELIEVDALVQALHLLSPRRTSHLYFEPVQSRFLLEQGRLLIPGLNLSSNLTDMQVTGEYHLNGQADLYVGLSPLQTLFGNNRKRIARIKSGEATQRRSRGLIYLHLHRPPGSRRYKVSFFKKQQQRQQQDRLREKYRHLLRQQPPDTVLWQ
ncbi:AsmA-like C-terminal region-containing protein [Hymenobacter sp. NST-14]|uniref:AsmA-like C-terminal region-containing protein n=1 Tax=Hymenobacter piscis TaxID=2839984 RepID=UPI001C00998B|nr:AsmA-like C-terminal region-containing protein [Hymenobacter piscis]MBT9392866.1 AsmA-like C-terminal region-containing protein [Hymenobacter piscis]